LHTASASHWPPPSSPTRRSSDLISTLDVNVSDELGTRPYELFSGGEKFRVDFAIRIALSKLLARRAGAPLQMLAIDEGFGTQDRDRKSTRLNSSHQIISYAVFCL